MLEAPIAAFSKGNRLKQAPVSARDKLSNRAKSSVISRTASGFPRRSISRLQMLA
jgi:hypothetical protein